MKIIPHLWYTSEALDAANLYTSIIENGKVNWTYTLKDTPSGDCDLVEFTLANMTFSAMSAGDYFKLNESISIMLSCSTKEEVRRIYEILIQGGKELMPLDEYDFCPLYVWIADKFGLNWQIMFDDTINAKHHIDICMLFDQEQSGKALDALNKYQGIFKESKIERISYYDGTQPDKRAKINYGELSLEDFKIIAMDHGYGGNCTFNEAFSLMILCDNDEEIEYYYNNLSHYKEAEQCGWIKDEFGISWQIVPKLLMEAYTDTDSEILGKLNTDILTMKRITFKGIKEIIGE